MHVNIHTKEALQADPIWKRLRTKRIWILFFCICITFALYNYVHQFFTTGNTIIIPVLFYGGGLLGTLNTQFRNEHYWKRIAARRAEALQDPQLFLASNQPLVDDEKIMALPLTLNLRWNKFLLSWISAIVLIPTILLLLISGFLIVQRHDQRFSFFFPLAFFIVIFVVFFLIFYFTSARYQSQTIEMTEEGIKTRYMRQERFLRWDEVRIFASYGAQGLSKNASTQVYELSNQQMVIRWSQLPLLPLVGFLLKVKSQSTTKEDWNWQIEHINAIVMAQTHLQLLDLRDRSQLQSTRALTGKNVSSTQRIGEVADNVISQPPLRLAQNDPSRRLWQSSRSRIAMATLPIGCAFLFLFISLLIEYSEGSTHSFLLTIFANYLLGCSILCFILTPLLLYVMLVGSAYQKHLEKKRLEALQNPQHFQIAINSVDDLQIPQPTSVRMRTRKTILFGILYAEFFVTILVIASSIFQPLQKNWLWIVIGTIIFALFFSLLSLPSVMRSSERKITLLTDGIVMRTGQKQSTIRWQDARMFTRYKAQRWQKRTAPTHVYELDSEQTAIRWQWPHAPMQKLTIEPAMEQEEFESWLEKLQNYTLARTHLPLLDLEK